MEHSNLEHDNDYKDELLSYFVGDISPLIFFHEITDDSLSPRNGLSPLDQVIMFEAGPYLDDCFNLDFVRACIIVEVAYMKKEFEEGLLDMEDAIDGTYGDLVDEEEYIEEDEEDFDNEDPYNTKPYIDDGYFYYEDDIDYYDDEYWEDYYTYTFDDERFQKKVRRLAVGYLAGKITTDNPSKLNGKTGYEQVVYYLAHLLPADNELEEMENIKKVDQKVQTYLMDFDGGANLVSLINSY